jgi:hypothetical protein
MLYKKVSEVKSGCFFNPLTPTLSSFGKLRTLSLSNGARGRGRMR